MRREELFVEAERWQWAHILRQNLNPNPTLILTLTLTLTLTLSLSLTSGRLYM